MFRLALTFFLLAAAGHAARDPSAGSLNKPERLEWFRDLGFGMFIHWSVDSQTGVVISRSLAGAGEAHTKRFFTELPKTFNPRKFYAQDWAALAKLASGPEPEPRRRVRIPRLGETPAADDFRRRPAAADEVAYSRRPH